MVCMMKIRLAELRNKEVINIHDGMRLGFVNDIGLELAEAKVTDLIIYGRPRLFGLLGKETDKIIPWEHVRTIGEDTILVTYTAEPKPAGKSCWLLRPFR